jgi:hypothetical protein
MLRRLVREALCHVHRQRRHLAAAMLLASPYARSVAEVALGLTAHDDERLANLCWSLVGRMASALSAHAVIEQLLMERRPRMRARAAAALMWVAESLPDDAVDVLARTALDPAETEQTVNAAVLALGLAGRKDRLTEIANATPQRVGALARWAIERGPAVRDQNHTGSGLTPTEPPPSRDRTAPDWH